MSKIYKLSKSKLLSFRQCPKRLWLQTHRPELAEIDDATSSVMASGTYVGETFRETYPDGVLVDTDDLVSALEMTRAFIASNHASPIFEATFQANDVLVRIDMLAPVEGGYRLVEVKSSTSVKNYHLDDATIQTWVAQNAGIPILKTEVAHIDNRFVYQGDEQYEGLFAEENVDAAVTERLPQVIHWVRDAQTMLQGEEPGICAGAQCYDPFACPFVGYCRRDEDSAEFPVEILPRNYGLAANLKADGYADLRDVPEDRLEKAIHQKVQRVTKSGIPELNSEAGRLVRVLPYPRYYLDFETIAFAVPRWANTRPYQQVPFQFSCHIELAPGTVAPSSFLSTDGTDPRRAFALAVIEAVNPKLLHDLGLQESAPGPVLVYNAAFERKRIEELAAMVDIPQTGWILLARQPSKDAFEPVDNTLRNTLLITVFLSIPLLAVLLAALSHLLQPFARLAGELHDMADGTRPMTPLRTHSTDEVADVAQSFNRLQDHLLKQEQRLIEMAHHDNLTGLPNRLTIMGRLENDLLRFHRNTQGLALLFLDLDGFKPVNDDYGHQVGDLLLIEIAQRLQACVRDVDTVARLGGDEFLILLSATEAPVEAAVRVAQECIKALQVPIRIGDLSISVGVSIGIATTNPADSLPATAAQLVSDADVAMYQAKAEGRNRYAIHPIQSTQEIEKHV